MTNVAKWLLGTEIALVLAGVSLLGADFAASAQRSRYQRQQQQVLLRAAEAPAPAAHRERGPGADAVGDPLALGRIEIPRVGVQAIVRTGEDDHTLAVAVGHIPGTARPGENGNTVFAGHRDTFFRGLRNIRLDDLIQVAVPPNIYEYRVVATQVVAPTETGVLDSRGIEELTLITCHPFNFIGSAPNRFIVRATPVLVRAAHPINSSDRRETAHVSRQGF